MATSEPNDSAEAPETTQSKDLERRNEELGANIKDAEQAVERRRDVTGETPVGPGDWEDSHDQTGGEDPKGAAKDG